MSGSLNTTKLNPGKTGSCASNDKSTVPKEKGLNSTAEASSLRSSKGKVASSSKAKKVNKKNKSSLASKSKQKKKCSALSKANSLKKEKTFCDVCKIQCNSFPSYQSHIRGKKHVKKVKLRNPAEIASKKSNVASKTLESQIKGSNSPSSDLKTSIVEKSTSQSDDRTTVNSNFTNLEENMAQYYLDRQQSYNFDRRPSNFRYRATFPPPNRRFFSHGPSWNKNQNPRYGATEIQRWTFPTFPNYGYRPQSNHFQNQLTQHNSGRYFQHEINQQQRGICSFDDQPLSRFEVSKDKNNELNETGKQCSNKASTSSGDVGSLNKESNSNMAVKINKLNAPEEKSTSASTNSQSKLPKASPRLKKLSIRKVAKRLSHDGQTIPDPLSKEEGNPSVHGLDQQKIKDYTNALLDTNHGQITRLLHPSNYKDKAAVNHLMTNLSKSKKKETLSRLRSNSLCSSGTNDDEDLEESKVIESEPAPSKGEVPSLPQGLDDLQTFFLNVASSGANSQEKEAPSESALADISSQNEVESEMIYADGHATDINSGVQRTVKRKTYGSSDRQAKRPNICEELRINSDKQNISSIWSLLQAPIPTNINSSGNKIPETSEVLSIKQEVTKENIPDQSQTLPVNSIQQDTEKSCDFTVNSLVKLFASGNVTAIKNENDPIIDALQSIDHDVLMKACSSQSIFENALNSESSSVSDIAKTQNIVKPGEDTTNCLNPAVSTSNTASHTVRVATPVQKNGSTVPSQGNISSKDQSSEAVSVQHPGDSSVVEDNEVNFVLPNKCDSSVQIKELVSELKEISCEEEAVKQNLEDSKCKIQEYRQLLDEWEKKKAELLEREETLRKKRIDLIELMQKAVKSTEEADNSSQSTHRESVKSPVKLSAENSAPLLEENLSPSPPAISSKKKSQLPQSTDSEDIQVISVKLETPEIIVIDDADSSEDAVNHHTNESDASTSDLSSNVPLLFETKRLEAHQTVVNCLLIFEDHLYTCSNDSTAKRFSLKDPSQTVSYLHSAKNVSEVVVEKVQCEALVLTSCSSARVLSLFIASNGTKIRTFVQPSSVMSICKGWSKFYCGLADGTINVYNWRYEEKEIIKSEFPVSRIATTDQGRLHILIVLTSNGHISVRDAETGLLIRYIKGFVKLPSWMTVDSDVAYLSSADKTLTILDIMTGRSEKKLYVSNHTTGLAVYKDYIFTISYSGVINCYNKEKMSEKKLYYGAGRNGLTCICVFGDQVLTGNRKGDVGLFHFDPDASISCQFGQCCFTYGLLDDLMYHLEKDHVLRRKNLSKCYWGRCTQTFPYDWTIEEKVLHMRGHIVSD